MSTLALVIRGDPQEIIRIAEEIEAHGAANGWPDPWVFNINLALDELITNAISYGRMDADAHKIRITLTDSGDALVTVMEDQGVPFDPLSGAPEPDLETELEDRRIGGLGVHFAKTLMDEVAYERRDERNCITLIQRAPK